MAVSLIKGVFLTNNSRIKNLSLHGYEVHCFPELDALEILVKTRDLIHKGHRLLTHPLHSSLKPNETPFRTSLISLEPGNAVDSESLLLIESAVHSYEKFLKDRELHQLSEKNLQDFALIDFDLMRQAVGVQDLA